MAKIYDLNTIDRHNYYGCQFASLRAQRYRCFTHTTTPYKLLLYGYSAQPYKGPVKQNQNNYNFLQFKQLAVSQGKGPNLKVPLATLHLKEI
jgi:hypothetical protein